MEIAGVARPHVPPCMQLCEGAEGPKIFAQPSELDAEEVIDQPENKGTKKRKKANPEQSSEPLALMVRMSNPTQLHKCIECLQPEGHLKEDGVFVIEVGPRDRRAHKQQNDNKSRPLSACRHSC